MKVRLDFTSDAQEIRFISEQLDDFNRKIAGDDGFCGLNITARDTSGQIIGGLIGGTYWGWMFIDRLWVDESCRFGRVGSDILVAAENEAIRRGCHSAHLNTQNYQAPGFYRKHGYRIGGMLANHPAGFAGFLMRKRLFSDRIELADGVQELRLDQALSHLQFYYEWNEIPIESYLEEAILKSRFFASVRNGSLEAIAALRDRTLTHFQSVPDFGKSIPDFLNRFPIDTIYAYTYHPAMMNLIADKNAQMCTEGYIFTDYRLRTDSIPIQPATSTHIAALLEMDSEFFDDMDRRISESQVYLNADSEEIKVVGILEHGVIHRHYASVGMYVADRYRNHGLGSSMIASLARYCERSGLIPISGCAAGNAASRKALEKAGYICTGRFVVAKL